MTWTTPTDWQAQVHRLWERGDLLRAVVSDAMPWPMRLGLKTPSTSDLGHRFEVVREWVAAWVQKATDAPMLRIEWREWNHRVQGAQRLPVAVWLDNAQIALAVVGKARQAQRFQGLWQQTAREQPLLLAWLSRRPIQALDLADRWARLLAVVAWLQAHPRPAVYLRQVDVPGVDSKFIEAHRGVLADLLDLALPPEVIDRDASGVAQFNRRYGFLDKPIRIRFRLLDSSVPSFSGGAGLPDIALDAASFAALAWPVEQVFITENETNFLAFPPVKGAIVIFGAGYGWEPLARAAWLQSCPIFYWGDIDTHGFAILDQLRGYFPRVVSFLMDRQTLIQGREHWGQEAEPIRHDLLRLTPEEAAVYDDLRFDRHQPRLRLEQERVGFGWLRERVLLINQ